MIDTASLNANELVSKLKSGDISSVDLCKAYIKRIEKFEKDVQAWAFLDKKILLEKAEEADEYRKSGKPLGALHGLPVAIKDIIGTYDMPTECGTVFRKKMSSSQDSEIVNLLKKKYDLDDHDLEIALTRVKELEEAIKKIRGVEVVEDLAQLNHLKLSNE